MIVSGRALCVTLALTGAGSACACGAGAVRPSDHLFAAPAPDRVRLVGRFDRAAREGPRFAWSASRIEVRFRGTGIAVRLRAAPPENTGEKATAYAVSLDDRSPFSIAVSSDRERYTLADDLDPAVPHTLTLLREAEAMAGVHQLLGFEVAGGGLLEPPPPKPRLEIVGDSITCGYGVLGDGPTCPFSYATERASLAYGAIATRELGWDLSTLCWSGRGVYRNYDEHDKPTMPALFELAVPDRTGANGVPFAFDAAPAPDAVLVSLGTNDWFSVAPEPFDPAAFEAAYLRFLDRLRAVYPRTTIAVATSPMVEGDGRAALGAALRRIAATAGVAVLELDPQRERQGCDGHPNAAMHRILGARVAAFLRSAVPRGR